EIVDAAVLDHLVQQRACIAALVTLEKLAEHIDGQVAPEIEDHVRDQIFDELFHRRSSKQERSPGRRVGHLVSHPSPGGKNLDFSWREFWPSASPPARAPIGRASRERSSWPRSVPGTPSTAWWSATATSPSSRRSTGVGSCGCPSRKGR